MSEVGALILDWQRRGIELLVNGDKLVSRAKPGAIDADTAAIIRAQKDKIIEFLQGRERHGDVVQQDYWRTQLRDLPQVHCIPLDFPRPQVRTTQSCSLEQHLPATLTERLRKVAQAYDTGIETVLQCALAIALCHWSRSDEVVMGNTAGLPLRITVQADGTIAEHLIRIRDQGLAASANSDVSFDTLVALADLEPSPSYAPLFQLALSFGNDDKFIGLDLSIHAREQDDAMQLTWRGASALFHELTLRGMMAGFARLLDQLGADDIEHVGDLQMVDAGDVERQQEWNRTSTPYPDTACLHTLIERQAVATPDRLALICGDDRLTYRNVNEKTNALAAELIEAGVRQGDIVAVVMQPGLEVPLSFLAIMKAGAAFAPLDHNWPLQRLQAALARLGDPIVLTNSAFEGDRADAQWLPVDWRSLGRADNLGLPMNSDASIYVMHTSGSTGEPKGALNMHRGIVNRLAFMSRYFGGSPDEIVLQTTHHCFDSAIWQFFWPMIKGGCSVVPRFGKNFDLAEIVKLITEHAVTLTDFSPALLSVFADHFDDNAAQRGQLALRELVVGGEEMTAAIALKCAKALPGVGLHNFYGVSEASIGCVHYRLPEGMQGNIPIGRPIDNVVVLLADPQLRPVPVGAVGEILLGGDCVGLGYVGQPEKTAAVFIELDEPVFGCRRYYRTGDLGRYRADGELEFLGRIDAQVKIRGFRIELGEIKAAIETLPQVSQAHVLLTGEAPNKQLTACLVASAPYRAEPDELRALVKEALSKMLPEYMLPSKYLVLDQIPLSPNGKIDRRALAQLVHEDQDRVQRVVPADQTERVLVSIWAELLKLPEQSISTTDNFFEIGGHSLLCIAVQSAIKKRLGHSVSVADLFLYPTVGHLGRFIRGVTEAGAARAQVLQGAKARILRARKG